MALKPQSVCRTTPLVATKQWTHSTPSLSGRLMLGFRQGRRCGPCRLTNTDDELDHLMQDDGYMYIDQYQVPNPELGPLERQVDKGFLEGIQEDTVSQEDMEYWFTEPDGGWNPQLKLRVPEIVPNEVAVGKNFGPDRIPIDEYMEGDVIEGEVTRLMLYMGAQVDFGANYDGIIPVTDEQWVTGVNKTLTIGTIVKARIHKIRDLEWFRFPVQLSILEPNIAEQLDNPDSWDAPVDLRDKPPDMNLYIQKTGRNYKPNRFWMPLEGEDLSEKYGADEEEETEDEEALSEYLVLRAAKIAARL